MALRFLRDGYFVGKVGIGTASPTQTLHVGDNSIDAVVRTTYTDGSYVDIHGYGIVMSRTASYIKPLNDGTQALYLGDANAGSTWDSVQINAETNVWKKDATEFMRLNSSGNLGIGITNPTVKLIVADGPKATSGTLSQNSTLDIYGVAATSRTDSATVDMLRLHRAVTSDNKGSTFAIGLSYYADPGSNLPRTRVDFKTTEKAVDDSDASKTVMSLVDSGNVGIGTIDPTAKLNIGSAYNDAFVLTDGRSGSPGNLYNSSIAWDAFYADAAKITLTHNDYSIGYRRLHFDVSGTEVMSLLHGGNVGIGTANPNAKLEVNSAITFATLDTFGQLVVKAASGSTGDMLNIGVDTANSVAFIQAIERGVNTIPLSLQRYGGNVGIGMTNPGTKLDVSGQIRTNDSFLLQSGSTAIGSINNM